MISWRIRIKITTIMLALILLAMIIGYTQEISSDDAVRLYKEALNYDEKLRSAGDVETTILNFFTDFAPIVIVSNIPFAGPVTVLFISFNAGYTIKAEYIATGHNALYTSLSESVVIVQLLALAIAGGEGLLQSYLVYRRMKADLFDSLAVITLEVSLVVLSAVLEAV
ncbi:MAG: hypothetical protein ACP5IE_00935 [Infirmifilum sp.]